MCADIHDGREQDTPFEGPNTDERDQLSPDHSHPACNTRPVHTDVPQADKVQRSKKKPIRIVLSAVATLANTNLGCKQHCKTTY